MKSLYILLVLLVLSVVSCRTKDGEPGPSGENTLSQQGYITGNIAFTDNSGAAISNAFKYEYYESLSDNRFYIYENGADSDYEIILNRREAIDNYNYFNFRLVGNNNMLDGTEEDPFLSEGDFYFVAIVNGRLYEFNGSNTDVTNVHLDTATGRLTFDFTGTVYYSNATATIAGTADVSLYRVYHSMISWG